MSFGKRYFFILLLFQFTVSVAQEAINWGPIFPDRNSGSKRQWLSCEDSSAIYIVKYRYFMTSDHWYLEAINKRSKQVIFSNELPQPLSEDKKDVTRFYSVVSMGEHVYLLSIGQTKQQTTLYATKVNKAKGFATGTKVLYSVPSLATEREIKFSFSPNGSNILLYASPFNTLADKMRICDSDLEEVWSGSVKFTEKIKNNYRFSACLDNKQNIVVYSGEAHTVSIYSAISGQGKSFPMLIPKETEEYNSVLKIDPKGTVYFLSMLKPERYEMTSGFIHAFLDPEKQTVGVTTTVMLDTFQLRELLGKHVGSKWQEMGLYYVKDVFFRESDIVVLSEQEYDKRTFQPIYYSSINPPFNGNSFLGNYYYTNFRNFTVEQQVNSISALNISYGGALNWVKMVPKNQAYPVNTYLSFAAGFDEENIYLIYNDDPGNVNAKPELGPRAMRNPKRARAVLATISKSGALTMNPFYRRKKNKGRVLKPAFCYTCDKKTYIFTESKKRARIGEFFPAKLLGK